MPPTRIPVAGPPLAPNAWLRFSLLRRLLVLPDSASFLEVGCGQGSLGSRLAEVTRYVGYEPDPASFRTAQRRVRSGTVINSVLPDMPTEGFDFVGAFEVLEHIEDDRAALVSWRNWLNPDGFLVLSVPAWMDRFGPWDQAVGHHRRYEPQEIVGLIEEAGFGDVRVDMYGFPLGYLLEALRNRLAERSDGGSIESRTAKSGRYYQPGDRLGWVTRLATVPFRLVQHVFRGTSWGTGIVLVARRQ